MKKKDLQPQVINKNELFFTRILFVILVLLSFVFTGKVYAENKVDSGLFNIDGVVLHQRTFDTSKNNRDQKRTFVIAVAIRDLDEFKKFVEQAERLKAYGKVQINISTLADKSFHEIPKGGNPWHEYAANKQSVYKFFPDPKIAPFVPAEFVNKNRQMLLEKAKILREHGMEAAFIGNDPLFLPYSFFEAYPHLRGPRVDHPRRSTHIAFSPCISLKETQAMYTGMTAELLKAAPEIKTFFFRTNDAGAGICWTDGLYSGPNGPDHCKNETPGEKMALLMNTFKKGAEKAGNAITIYITAGPTNFSPAEKMDIQAHMPVNTYFEEYNTKERTYTGAFTGESYPVVGILNPLALIKRAKTISQAKTIFINWDAAYDRGNENIDVFPFFIDIIEKQIHEPIEEGTIPALQRLQYFCEKWGGKTAALALADAFIAFDNVVSSRNTIADISLLYWGVSTRHITRPLVIVPQKLTEKEEAYFLPFVFNISKEEARMDYADIHGNDYFVQPGMAENYVAKLKQVYLPLENNSISGPKEAFFKKMAISLRMYASFIRSSGNFSEAQIIRNRNSAKLNGPMHLPGKDSTWTGDPDLLRFNEIMRDELDNTQELINLLQNGGLELICRAKDALHEDTFLLGPDIIEQLKMKRKIMLAHWLDIEWFLISPNK